MDEMRTGASMRQAFAAVIFMLSISLDRSTGFSISTIPFAAVIHLKTCTRRGRHGAYGHQTLQTAALAEGVSAEDGLKSVKTELVRTLTKGTGMGLAADARDRPVVNELVLKLERRNPTQAPAASKLLNGAWEMLYTGLFPCSLATCTDVNGSA